MMSSPRRPSAVQGNRQNHEAEIQTKSSFDNSNGPGNVQRRGAAKRPTTNEPERQSVGPNKPISLSSLRASRQKLLGRDTATTIVLVVLLTAYYSHFSAKTAYEGFLRIAPGAISKATGFEKKSKYPYEVPIISERLYERNIKKYNRENPYDPNDMFQFGPDVNITEGMHVSSPLPPLNKRGKRKLGCSCWMKSSNCCFRGVQATHKFGHFMAQQQFGENSPGYNGEVTTRNKLEPKKYLARQMDYRTVQITREWYSALISGYLYHLGGHECWTSGISDQKVLAVPFDCNCLNFERFLQVPKYYPPIEYRNLCQYLIDESEYDGMRVYAEYVIRRYYAVVVRLFKAVQVYEDPEHRKTLFMCFEDLYNPETKMEAVENITHHLYPGGGRKTPPLAEKDVSAHITSHDPKVRERLMKVVEKVDMEVFDGEIAKASALFGCGTRNRKK